LIKLLNHQDINNTMETTMLARLSSSNWPTTAIT